jgi:hypothetical protein
MVVQHLDLFLFDLPNTYKREKKGLAIQFFNESNLLKRAKVNQPIYWFLGGKGLDI